jgi:DNA-binding IclR family transcriptional regulator
VLQTVDHALAVLEAFGPDCRDLGVAELSRMLRITGPSTYRLLSTLEARGFVEQDPKTKRYRLGLKLFEIASRISSGLSLVDIAHPNLEWLVQVTQETAFLAIWDQDSALSIDKVDSPLQLFLRTTIGARRPPNGASTAKCLLAFQPRSVIDQVLAKGLPKSTPHSQTDPDEFRAELEQVRRQGYAINRGGFHEQASGIAAPIRDRHQRVVASIAVGVPTSRMAEERIPELVEAVLTAASAVSTQLGLNPRTQNGTTAHQVAPAGTGSR